ncbi:hypothetical protein MTR62_13550 [Novosphingobium sp. 1949]|uniref:Uncharacterized protein n=1 Tax=Novosphingobium organovorum TaxID=2930092 RepID=A0ABT0BF86_9SPHN|nr:hypothetical protein [Novosphingobium organovorum]MCJ2183707.1 hypothetical protein [Novosphingobium organovorum]
MELGMESGTEDLRKEFRRKQAKLVAELEAWFEDETQPIDGSAPPPPSGGGGSIIGVRPAIDSKRVIDASRVTRQVLDIELPPEIIKQGGYASCDEMISDLVPKLERVYTGELKVKKRRPFKVSEPA